MAGGLRAGVSVGLGLAWACSGQAGLESLGRRCLGGARGFVVPGEAVAGAGGRQARESMHACMAGGLGAGVSVGSGLAWACSRLAGLESLGSICLGGARGFCSTWGVGRWSGRQGGQGLWVDGGKPGCWC
jgi:hypothetical protein